MSYLIGHALELLELGRKKSGPAPAYAPEVNLSWYVVLTLPRDEIRTANRLCDEHFPVYCPQFLRSVKVNAIKRVRRAFPLFPGYIFVRFDAASDRWSLIPQTEGVRRVLMFNEKPVPVVEDAMQRVRDREAEENSGKRKLPPIPIMVGSTVTVTDHFSFTGLPLVVVATDAKRQKVAVQVNLLGALTSVWLSVNQVKVV